MHSGVLSGLHQTWICESESPDVSVFVPMGDHAKESCESLSLALSSDDSPSCRVICFPVDDWDRDLTPWPAPGVFRNQHFDGCAHATLAHLQDHLFPEYRSAFNVLAGYSLAGLFSLWALTASQLFCGAACCSGSLWYPGFMDYLHSASFPDPSYVYLSLGDLEEKAKNPILRTIGDETRKTAELLSQRAEIHWSDLEMNKGNHFHEPDLRTARGIIQLVHHVHSIEPY